MNHELGSNPVFLATAMAVKNTQKFLAYSDCLARE